MAGYPCPECGKTMATAGGLDIHLELAHNSEPSDTQPAAVTMTVPVARATAPDREPETEGRDPTVPLAWVLVVLLFLGSVAAAIHDPRPPADVVVRPAASSVSAR